MIDSLNASLAQGILAIYASEMRSQGMDFDTIADTLETYPARMNGIFTVGDLKYLAKTGRLSGSAALEMCIRDSSMRFLCNSHPIS